MQNRAVLCLWLALAAFVTMLPISGFGQQPLLTLGAGIKASGGGGGVTIDGTIGTEQYGSPATSKNYTGVTVVSGNALVATLDFGYAVVPPSGITAVWDTAGGSPTNQSMTQIIRADGASNSTAALFQLMNPTPGNNTLTVSWTGVAEVFVSAIPFSGVNPAGGATSFPNSASNTVAGTVTITSASGHYVVGASAAVNNGVSGTPIQLFADLSNGVIINAAAAYGTGAPTVAVGVTGSGTADQVNVGTDVAP